MAREIKFRVWDKDNKQMTQSDGIAIRLSGEVGYTLSEFVPMPHMVLMQFTGLHDRNNKEIYEGDILQQSNNVNLEHQVIWREESASFGVENSDLGVRGCLEQSWINEFGKKVIGNIYENPELISGKPDS